MAAKIRFKSLEAAFEKGVWKSEPPGWDRSLNISMKTLPYLGYTPNYEHAVAQYMAKKYGAKVVSVDPVPDTAPPGAVY